MVIVVTHPLKLQHSRSRPSQKGYEIDLSLI